MKPQSDAISGKRILLVEDDRVTRETLRLLLTGDSHTVIEANNGAEAFSLFRSGRFDLVITDYEIPFVKGNELAAQIKQLAPRQPILMITAYPHKSGPDNPVDAVVNKSFTPIRLRGIVAELISAPGENHQSSQAARFRLVSPRFETEIIPA